MTRTVAIAGLGAIGLPLARALDAGVEGLTLVGRGPGPREGNRQVANFRAPPPIVDLAALSAATSSWRLRRRRSSNV